jgi:hypothetical protein
MVIEIRYDGLNVKVRRFGLGRPASWTVILPGEVDDFFTHFTYDRLRELGEGVWEMPAEVGVA